MLTDRQLLELKQRVDASKNKVSQLEGQLSLLQSQLKKDWRCDDLEQAAAKLEEIEREIKRTERELNNQKEALETKYSDYL